MLEDRCKSKYPQLYALVQCVILCSDENAVPERGFSCNKKIWDVRGYSIEGDTTVAIHLRVYHLK